jgi:Aerotolerance regulator N-terminal
MIWLNPWAWVGLASIAAPVVLHLLGRGPARVVRFPTLRFIQTARLLPVRRTRVHDAAVLAIRVATLVAAVAALARPFWLTKPRAAADTGVARAIVVDTGVSMRRRLPSGGTALDSARAQAKWLAADAKLSVSIEAPSAAIGLRLASGWAARQTRRAEIVVVSDFPAGDLDSTDVAAVPAYVGLSFHELRPTADSGWHSRWSVGGTAIAAEGIVRGGVSTVSWSSASSGPDARVTVRGDGADPQAIAALREAAATVAVEVAGDTSRRVEIMFSRDAPNAGSLDEPSATWMLALIARLRVSGVPVVAFGTRHDPERLVVLTNADPLSAPALQLVAAARHAASRPLPPPGVAAQPISRAVLASWERAPSLRSSIPSGPDDDRSDGRWLWVAVLALLGVESVLRRRPAQHAPDASEGRARAA